MLECIPFDGLMQRHHHLARRLSKYLPVVYVESTPSRLKFLIEGRPFDRATSRFKEGLREAGENLYVYKAPPYFPRSRGYVRAMKASAERVAAHLKPLLPKDRRVILWIFSPYGLHSVGMYDEILSVFDCFDAFGEFPGERQYRTEIIEAMNELAGRADLVVTTTDELRDRLVEFNPHTFVVQNGCEPEHFASGGVVPIPEKRILDIESLPKPIIGYMGDIAPWVDLKHLFLAAERHPEWSIVLLGPWKREKPSMSGFSNVHAPGGVSYEELPYYARMFDVGTIPFALNDLTRVVNPLKLYEYFAMGKPVVATPLPEVARHEELVYLAGGPDEFVALTEIALREEPSSPARERRIKIARENSWESRVERIRTLLKDALNRKQGREEIASK